MKCFWLKILLLLSFPPFLVACQDRDTNVQEVTEPQETKESDKIFHTQKRLSAGDSLHIRVLSWGGEKLGNYLVLMADSAGPHYVGNSFFRQGKLTHAWVDDLDGDGLSEVGVVVQEQQGSRYGKLRLHELTEGFTFNTINLPQFSETLGADYGGHDTIYRDQGRVVREFRLLDRADTSMLSSGKRRIVYQLENNQLEIAESENIMN